MRNLRQLVSDFGWPRIIIFLFLVLLFVSEPTRGIDVGAKKLVLDALRRYNSEYGTTIVMVSSELEELRAICDRIAIVSEGRLAGILPPRAETSAFGLLMAGERVAQAEEATGA